MILDLKDRIKFSYNFFGYDVTVHRDPKSTHIYPWMFFAKKKGHAYWFAGIPNKCETRHSAMMKAYYQCKYLFKCEVLGCSNGMEVIE